MFEILSICKGGGYRYCRTNPPHPRRNAKGLYPLHRVLLENKLGRLLLPGEETHHKDEDKTNDDPGNLELKTKPDHTRYHQLKKSPGNVHIACPCGKTLRMKARVARLRRQRNKSGVVYCSRSCGAKIHQK